MDLKELKQNIEIVFSKEVDEIPEYVPYGYTEMGSAGVSYRRFILSEDILTSGAKDPFLITENPEESRLIYKNMDLLCALYAQLSDQKLKKYFISYLRSILMTGKFGEDKSDHPHLSILSLATLINLNYKTNAFKYLEYRIKNSFLDMLPPLLFLSDFLRYKYDTLDEKDINKILKIAMNTIEKPRSNRENNKVYQLNLNSVTTEIQSQVRELKFSQLSKQLKGINYEINQDRDKVIEQIKYFGFNTSLIEFLIKLDRYMYNNDPLIDSGMVGNLRTFMENLVVSIAEEIKKKTREEYPALKGKSDIGNKRVYIKQKLKLTDTENDLVNNLVDILHTKGGHSYATEKKYFRLARNMCIEVSYFLLSKLEDFKNIKSS